MRTRKVVPSGAPTSSSSFWAPPSILYLTPERDSGHLVINSTWDTALILDSASPLNPSDDMPRRSAAVFILLVECRKNATLTSSLWIPHPLSVTLISVMPPSFISTVMALAPASMAFSTNSFTTDEGLSTTSPAAILFIVLLSRMLIDIYYHLFLILSCMEYN